MPLPWQRPVKDFASRSMFSSFGKMKNDPFQDNTAYLSFNFKWFMLYEKNQ